jgi:hypothetical protein
LELPPNVALQLPGGLRQWRAAKDDLIRIVDEDGEDYLFEASQFERVEFP